MDVFLSYDLKGIQSFIFQVPRVRYIIGGSFLIDDFDRRLVRELVRGLDGAEIVFSGGGKGVFRCQDEHSCRDLREHLIDAAHGLGLEIHLAEGDSAFAATRSDAADAYPYFPDDLEGEPCRESGLYPVASGQRHPIVQRRLWMEEGGKRTSVRDSLGDSLLEALAEERLLPPLLVEKGECKFFSDVEVDGNDGPHRGRHGLAALGGRGRWAVVVMDGNDAGRQFRAMTERLKDDSSALSDSYEKLSTALAKTSRKALLRGIGSALDTWCRTRLRDVEEAWDDQNEVQVLPFRPLIVGGDDIVVLCHCALAMDFVREVCRVFEQESQKRAELWPQTGGRLTISAGILYAPVSYPLHTALPYAESLLSSAKGEGRKYAKENPGAPAPACVDWESVTEGLLDTPTNRRRRELSFIDADESKGGDPVEVHLSCRPYRVSDLETLDALQKKLRLPAGILLDVLPSMRAGRDDRSRYLTRLRKHQQELADMLEDGSEYWIRGEKGKSLKVVDAISLMEESRRMAEDAR